MPTYRGLYHWPKVLTPDGYANRLWLDSMIHGLRRRRPRPGDKWYLDEVFILMTPLIIQTTPKTSVNSGWSRSITEKRCIGGRSLTSGMVGIRS